MFSTYDMKPVAQYESTFGTVVDFEFNNDKLYTIVSNGKTNDAAQDEREVEII